MKVKEVIEILLREDGEAEAVMADGKPILEIARSVKSISSNRVIFTDEVTEVEEVKPSTFYQEHKIFSLQVNLNGMTNEDKSILECKMIDSGMVLYKFEGAGIGLDTEDDKYTFLFCDEIDETGEWNLGSSAIEGFKLVSMSDFNAELDKFCEDTKIGYHKC